MTGNLMPLSDDQIAVRLATLPGWQRDGDAISKSFAMESYTAGLAFASAVGTICEGFDHHPDRLCIGWKKVEVSFTTHSAGSRITPLDFDVAEMVEALPFRKP
jgi:4a-hydroxytetrahydrobiopterin dehydratase